MLKWQSHLLNLKLHDANVNFRGQMDKFDNYYILRINSQNSGSMWNIFSPKISMKICDTKQRRLVKTTVLVPA